MFQHFILHVITSKNVYAKTFAKLLQNIFENVLARWTIVEDRGWLHVK